MPHKSGTQKNIAVTIVGAIIICMVSGFAASPLGIFLSPEDDNGDSAPFFPIVNDIRAEYNARIEQIKNSVPHTSLVLHGNPPDFVEVIAVYAVRTSLGIGIEAMDVVTVDDMRAELIKSVFWDMTTIAYNAEVIEHDVTDDDGNIIDTWEEVILHICINSKSYSDMPAYYGFAADETEMLYYLMEQRALISALIGRGRLTSLTASIGMADADLYAFAAAYGVTLPAELSIERKNVLKAAIAGVQYGIPYHYNWRSYYQVFPGLEGNDFGVEVTADYKGRDKKGLDCSGFVGWAYYTGGITWSGFGFGESDGQWHFHATPTMRSLTQKIDASDLAPGDIGFISDSASGTSDHTGIYLGENATGTEIWLHCSGGSGAICVAESFTVFYRVENMDVTFGDHRDFTEQEIRWLASLIYWEGRGYGSYCKELIAQVAVNRVNDPRFPDTLEDVLKQPGQYGYGSPGLTGTLIFSIDWEDIEGDVSVKASCIEAARKVASGLSVDESGKPWPANILYQHSFPQKDRLGEWFKSYTDPSGKFTEHFNYG